MSLAIHATELLGGEAYDVQGNFVGRVRELFIEPADQPSRVARFLLDRDKYLPCWRDTTRYEPSRRASSN